MRFGTFPYQPQAGRATCASTPKTDRTERRNRTHRTVHLTVNRSATEPNHTEAPRTPITCAARIAKFVHASLSSFVALSLSRLVWCLYSLLAPRALSACSPMPLCRLSLSLTACSMACTLGLPCSPSCHLIGIVKNAIDHDERRVSQVTLWP